LHEAAYLESKALLVVDAVGEKPWGTRILAAVAGVNPDVDVLRDCRGRDKRGPTG
jgi:hypothetical protein